MSESRKEITNELVKTIKNFKRSSKHIFPNIGIKPGEMMLLMCINESSKEQEGIKANELSEIMKVSTPLITQLLNSLISKDLITKDTDKIDKRAVRIRLTPKSKELIEKVEERFFSVFYGIVEQLGEKDSKELIRLFIKVNEHLNNSVI